MNKTNKLMLSTVKVLSLALCVALSSCAARVNGDKATDADAGKLSENTELDTSVDAGEDYIDSIIFIGESTTYHLKSRGVLRDGQKTKQVWSTSMGTMMLDSDIANLKIVYPDTGEEMTLGEAARLKRPERFVLTFGLNGAVNKIKRGEQYYKSCYLSLIKALRDGSPDSRIIIQACPPIAENMDVSAYGVDTATLNSYIDTLNGWARDMCAEQGLYYMASNSALKDGSGYLASEYQIGDGYHLSTAAYEKMLDYIRTHAVK